MGVRGHPPIRPRGRAGRCVRHRYPTTDRLRLAAHGARVLLHPHRRDRPLPTDERQVRLLPDGLGRQRPPDRTARPELLRGALRPQPALRGRLRTAVPRRPPQGPPGHPRLETELPRALRRARRARREGLRGVVPSPRPVGGLVAPVRHDRRAQPPREPARVPPQPRSGGGLQPRGPNAVGRRLPDSGRPGRDGGSRATGCLPPSRLPPQRRLR